MRRLLVPFLLLPLLAGAAPASAGCDESGCYPSDCLTWQPNAATAVQHLKAGDAVGAATAVLPPTCG